MSSVHPPAAQPPATRKPRDVEYVEYEKYIDQQVQRTRRAVKLVDLTQAMVTLVIGLLAVLIGAAVLEHWIVPGGLGSVGRGLLFLGIVAASGYVLVRKVWPLLRQPINPAYAAYTIEREHPTLKNSLLNFLLFRTQKSTMPAAMYDALEEQAARRLSQTPVEDSVDRTALVKLGYVLLAVVAAAIVYATLSPKSSMTTAARVLMPWANIAPPSRVQIADVVPGHVEIVEGEVLEVSAQVYGLRTDEQVRLSYDTADGHRIDQQITMQPANNAGKFACRLPAEDSTWASTGIDQELTYRILAGDGRTIDYRVTVQTAPTIRVRRVHYDFPAYTGYNDRTEENRADIRAIEGTRVTLFAEANTPIESAFVDLASDGKNDVRMRIDGDRAQAELALQLDGDRRTVKSSSYMVRYTSAAGLPNNEPSQHALEIRPDYPPEIELTTPEERRLDVELHETVSVAVDARDPDFALRNVVLKFTKPDGSEVHQQSLLSNPHEGRYTGQWDFRADEHDLQPGDVVEYWAEAIDVRRPQANRATSQRQQLRIVGGQQQDKEQGERQADDRGQEQDQRDGEQGSEQAGEGQPGEQQDQGQGEPSQGNETGQGEPSEDGPQGEGSEGNQSGDAAEQPEGGQQAEGGAPGDAGEQANGDQGGEQSEPSEGGPQGERGDQTEDGEQGDRPDQQQGTDGQPGEGGDAESTEPVANDGTDDATAFEKIRRNLTDEERQQASRQDADGQSADETDDRTEQGQAQQDDEAQQDQESPAAGEESPDQSPEANDQGGSAEETSSGEQGDTASQSTSSDPRRDDQPSETDGESTATPEPQGEPAERDQREDLDEQGETDSSEPPASGDSRRESDSRGEEGGTETGGGEEGGGQDTPREGTGSDGQNQAADEGGGTSADQGPGETGQRGGQAQEADEETGTAGEQPGEGSTERQGDAADAESQPGEPQTGESGENQPGEASRDGQSESEGQADGGEPSDGQPAQANPAEGDPAETETGQPSSEGTPGDRATDADDQQADEAGEQENQPAGEQPSQPTNESPSDGNSTPGPTGAPGGAEGMGEEALPEDFEGQLAEGDQANQQYTREQIDLVLDELSEQLDENQVDEEMLDELGWSEEDLQRFVDRWNRLRTEAQRPDGEQARQELDARLRSLGPALTPVEGRTERQQDTIRDFREGYQNQVPLKFRDRLKAYTEGVSKSRDE